MKRTRTLQSYFSPASSQQKYNAPATNEEQAPEIGEIEESAETNVEENNSPNNMEQNDAAIDVQQNNRHDDEFSSADIVADPGLRMPIEEINPNVRDDVKREYVLKGPCQPKGHVYPRTIIGDRPRSFHDEWFKDRPWLEYSIAKDKAYCFYCYLFKQPRAENFGTEAFTTVGFNYWKNGIQMLDSHAKSIAHNNSRKDYQAYKNQRQSVNYAMTTTTRTKKSDEEYKGRMFILLGITRFLLLQGHAFRGHDESAKSTNKGNFLEMVEWYKDKDEKAALLFKNAGKNHQMTSPKIQKDLCKACAQQTSKAIIKDIGNRKFAVLVDESRDASIKEQMAVVLRLVFFSDCSIVVTHIHS